MAGNSFCIWDDDGRANPYGVGQLVSHKMTKKAKEAWDAFSGKLDLHSNHIGFYLPSNGPIKEFHGSKWSYGSVRWEPIISNLSTYDGCPSLQQHFDRAPKPYNKQPSISGLGSAAQGLARGIVDAALDPGNPIGNAMWLANGIHTANVDTLNYFSGSARLGDVYDRVVGSIYDHVMDAFLPENPFPPIPNNNDGDGGIPKIVISLFGEDPWADRFGEADPIQIHDPGNRSGPPGGGGGGVIAVDVDDLVSAINHLAARIDALASGQAPQQERVGFLHDMVRILNTLAGSFNRAVDFSGQLTDVLDGLAGEVLDAALDAVFKDILWPMLRGAILSMFKNAPLRDDLQSKDDGAEDDVSYVLVKPSSEDPERTFDDYFMNSQGYSLSDVAGNLLIEMDVNNEFD